MISSSQCDNEEGRKFIEELEIALLPVFDKYLDLLSQEIQDQYEKGLISANEMIDYIYQTISKDSPRKLT